MPELVRTVGKRTAGVIGMVLTAVGYVQFAIVLAALGLVPRTPTPQTALAICVSKFIGTLGSYINGCAILGMWADCVEECEVT